MPAARTHAPQRVIGYRLVHFIDAEPMSHMLISHVREDYEAVKRLAADLRQYGVTVWLDRDRLRPGERWQRRSGTPSRTALVHRLLWAIATLGALAAFGLTTWLSVLGPDAAYISQDVQEMRFLTSGSCSARVTTWSPGSHGRSLTPPDLAVAPASSLLSSR
jgi:TIR domain